MALVPPLRPDGHRGWTFFSRCLALCAAAALVAVALFALGAGRILLFLILSACLLRAIWVYLPSARPLPVDVGQDPSTKNRSMNWLAPWYNRLSLRCGLNSERRRRIVELADIHSGDHVLDLGCATGMTCHWAARATGKSGKIVGVDVAPDMIRLAREQAAAVDPRPEFLLAPAEKLPFANHSFDVVLASQLLSQLPDAQKVEALREARRVLKSGRHMVVVELDCPHTAATRALTAPLCCSSRIRSHLSGNTEKLLRQVGFAGVRAGERMGLLGTWRASPTANAMEQQGEQP